MSGGGGRSVLARRCSCCGSLFYEFESAGAAQNSGAFVACAGALGFFEVSFDVVAVAVALHGENSVRVVLADVTFGFELGAAVVSDFSIDYEIAGATFFTMLSVEDAVLDRAGKFKFVGGSFSVGFAGHVSSPGPAVAGACCCRAGAS